MNEELEDFEDFSLYNFTSIFYYIKNNFVKFILLILTFFIIFVVEYITHINNIMLSFPPQIPGIPIQTTLYHPIIKFKTKKRKLKNYKV